MLQASISSVPSRGHTLLVDVTAFVNGLLARNTAFAGFGLRAGSMGTIGLNDARLSATPEPASLTLLAIGGIGALAQRRRRLHG